MSARLRLVGAMSWFLAWAMLLVPPDIGAGFLVLVGVVLAVSTIAIFGRGLDWA